MLSQFHLFKPRVFNLWPTGQIWPTEPWKLTCRAPHGLGNLVAGEQCQLTLPPLPIAKIPSPMQWGHSGHNPPYTQSDRGQAMLSCIWLGHPCMAWLPMHGWVGAGPSPCPVCLGLAYGPFHCLPHIWAMYLSLHLAKIGWG